jgi:hypothetical protein
MPGSAILERPIVSVHRRRPPDATLRFHSGGVMLDRLTETSRPYCSMFPWIALLMLGIATFSLLMAFTSTL